MQALHCTMYPIEIASCTTIVVDISEEFVLQEYADALLEQDGVFF